jgi:hypothetical protein
VRFEASRTYGLSVAARGTQDGSAPDQSSYIKFRSDRIGHEVRFIFGLQATAVRSLVFGVDHDAVYFLGNIVIDPIAGHASVSKSDTRSARPRRL